jgi:thioredoxin 2
MTLSAPLGVNVESFEREVIDYSRPVIVAFLSSTCAHCARYEPEFATAAQEAGGPVRFVRVSAQEAPALFRRYAVQATPTTLLFRGGVEIARRSGAMTKDQLLSWMRQSLQAEAA